MKLLRNEIINNNYLIFNATKLGCWVTCCDSGVRVADVGDESDVRS